MGTTVEPEVMKERSETAIETPKVRTTRHSLHRPSLAAALRRAAAAHGEHEKRTGGHDAGWPDWYADYMVREQAGKELPL
jgi:hypothetical protein